MRKCEALTRTHDREVQTVHPVEPDRALVQRKYRRLFGSKEPMKPGPKGPGQEVIAAVVDMKQRNPSWASASEF
jgi:hypothetical protein